VYYRTLGAKQIRLISRILGLEGGLLDVFLAFGLGTNRIAAVFACFLWIMPEVSSSGLEIIYRK